MLSINARGLGSQHKRRDVMHFLKNMECDVILLQDTHLIKEKNTIIQLTMEGQSLPFMFYEQ